MTKFPLFLLWLAGVGYWELGASGLLGPFFGALGDCTSVLAGTLRSKFREIPSDFLWLRTSFDSDWVLKLKRLGVLELGVGGDQRDASRSAFSSSASTGFQQPKRGQTWPNGPGHLRHLASAAPYPQGPRGTAPPASSGWQTKNWQIQ